MSERRSPAGLFRAFRDRYVTSFGGLSYDLAPGVVGLSADLVQVAPELVGRTVLVSDGRGPPSTLDHRPSFLVVALSRVMRNASEVADQAGGVVFSTFDLDTPRAAPLLSHFGTGDTLYLNSAVDLLGEVVVRRPTFSTPDGASS